MLRGRGQVSTFTTVPFRCDFHNKGLWRVKLLWEVAGDVFSVSRSRVLNEMSSLLRDSRNGKCNSCPVMA
jgi:hypothetical protein